MKFRSAITVSAVPEARLGPFVFHGENKGDFSANLHTAKEIGFDAVELFLPNSQTVSSAETKASLDQLSLALAAVGSGAGWVVHQLSLTSPDIENRKRAIEFVRSLIEWAGEWKAPVIIGSMQGRVGPGEDRKEVLKRLSGALQELSDYAQKEFGSHLFYEPLNRYETNLFNRTGDTAQWLESEGLHNVYILADLFHMNIEESNIAEAIASCTRSQKNWLGHVHWADSNRQAMGFGHTEVAPIVDALKKSDYQGYLSGEVFPNPSSRDSAAQTLRSIRSI